MKLIYQGVHDAVELRELGIVAERDTPVDVPDTVAKGLLDQDAWTLADKPKGGK